MKRGAWIMGGLAAALVGCASTPRPTSELADARIAFAEAAAGPARKLAPQRLRKAAHALDQAEDAYLARQDEEARHHAYVARRRAEAADAVAHAMLAGERRAQAARTLLAAESALEQRPAPEVVVNLDDRPGDQRSEPAADGTAETSAPASPGEPRESSAPLVRTDEGKKAEDRLDPEKLAPRGTAAHTVGTPVNAGTLERVRDRLQEAKLDAIQVQVTGSTVILTGVVPDDETRARALELARTTEGVRTVEDRLRSR